MRVSSTSSTAVRTAPQQKRATRRLAAFLDAAAALFAEAGYEAVTMTAIAERSQSSIGALYNYFPDKQAIALTLMMGYAQEIEAHWKPLMQQAKALTNAEFAERFIQTMTDFVNDRPASLRLITAPVRFTRDPASRRALRVVIADAFCAKNPALPQEQAMLAANVTVQIVRGLMTMYGTSTPRERPVVAAEFKRMLTIYLAEFLPQQPLSAAKKSRPRR